MNNLNPGQVTKLKAIMGIGLALLLLYSFFMLFTLNTDKIKAAVCLLFAILCGAILWTNKGRRKALSIMTISLVVFSLFSWLYGIGTGSSVLNTGLGFLVLVSVNNIFFYFAEYGKSRRTNVIKPIVIILNIIMALFLGWPGILYTVFLLFYAYILYQCYDPVFHKAFFKQNPRDVIRNANLAAGIVKYSQYSLVKLLTDEYAQNGVQPGDIGYIFELYDEACKIYFTDKEGKTTAALVIPYDDLEIVS